MGDTAFQRYLVALSAEYERVVIENSELRQGMREETGTLFRLRKQEEQPPPLQPITAYHEASTVITAVTSFDLPGVMSESLQLTPDKVPATPSGNPKVMKRQNSRAQLKGANNGKVVVEDEETEAGSVFLLLLDVIPAVVIMMSAVVAGLSADISPDHIIWKVFEAAFTIFFIGEIFVKLKVFGCREFLTGADWYWSWFDILCVITALIDMGITYGEELSANPDAPEAAENNSAAGTLGTLKMLKLARLGRIVRLLKFKIFQELKLMIQGVFTGLRVLFWAVVLFGGCMYLLGVVTRTLYGNTFEEFNSVPSAMFTSFRCFTDGCSDYKGQPLQEQLRIRNGGGGGVFMVAYMLLFLFVTIGIFNLIMAVFIDNVTEGSTKKRQRQLGANGPKTEYVIANILRHIILTNLLRKEAEIAEREEGADGRRISHTLNEKLLALQEMYGYKPHTTEEYVELTEKIRDEMSERDVVVTKEEFNHWLTTEKEFISKLDDSEIDLSCKFDLFDVLDADLSGELEFDEMVDGLIKCRGPASKTDIIAIRLKTALLVKMITKLCEKLGIDDL